MKNKKSQSSWKRERRKKLIYRRIIVLVVIVVLIFVSWLILREKNRDSLSKTSYPESAGYQYTMKPSIKVDLLTKNDYSRPGDSLKTVNNIVIHYVANPKSSAKANRNYFEGLKDSHDTSASAHFVIGLEGEIIQCIPTTEIAYASNTRNKDTISIECCHQDEGGEFNEKTYQSLIQLCSYLLGKFQLGPDALIRHYDVTGKMCPKFYVEHPQEWDKLKQDVSDFIREKGSKKE